MQRRYGLLTVVGGAAGAPLFQQRNSPYPRLTLSIQILLHRNTNLDLHACGKKKFLCYGPCFKILSIQKSCLSLYGGRSTKFCFS